jgi:LysM repeat protein
MKRYIFLLFGLFSAFLGAFAQQAVWNQRFQDYFDTYKDVAIDQMLKYHIPASITLAQGVLESGAGRSELTRRSNNHFGIKCHGWTGRKSYHDDDELGECFRAYDSAYESYQDHSIFLTSSQRYSSLFRLKRTDYKGWARGLKACGYATSPTYATRLIEIIELYKLYRYDSEHHVDKYQLEQVRHQGGIIRQVHEFNNNYYVVAKKGDTFRSIADDTEVSYRKLAKFNERDKNDVLEEGEYVWLQKKRRKAPKEYKGFIHYVKDGESMYSIAQKYGIRLKNLYKMNHLTPDYRIRVGEPLRVR